MNLSKLLSNPKIRNLPSPAFKAYFILFSKSKDGVIEEFSIRGLTREWQEDSELNLVTSRNSVKEIIRVLESEGLVSNDQENKKLIFK